MTVGYGDLIATSSGFFAYYTLYMYMYACTKCECIHTIYIQGAILCMCACLYGHASRRHPRRGSIQQVHIWIHEIFKGRAGTFGRGEKEESGVAAAVERY